MTKPQEKLRFENSSMANRLGVYVTERVERTPGAHGRDCDATPGKAEL